MLYIIGKNTTASCASNITTKIILLSLMFNLFRSTETFVLYIAYINTKKMETMRKIEKSTISSK